MAAFLASFLVLTSFQTTLSQWKQWQCQGRVISKRYFNYAEGFSIAIPRGFRGRAGQEAGPERGVAVPLSCDCTGVMVVYGEANSFEWATPADAITWEVQIQAKNDPQAEIQRYRTRLGNLKAAAVTIRHPATSEVEDIVVAFRPRGEPIYTARLSTIEERYKRDRDVFMKALRGFRLEVWR